MSRGSRQEAFIRAMVRGLCKTVKQYYEGQPRQKIKLEAAAAIQARVEDLCRLHPIELTDGEKERVIAMIRWCEALPEADYSRPEVLIGVCLALVERLRTVTRGAKQAAVGALAGTIQNLYETYDRRAQPEKLDFLLQGAGLVDGHMLTREI